MNCLRQPLWRICLERAQDFMFQLECSVAGILSGGRHGCVAVCRRYFAKDLSATPETSMSLVTESAGLDRRR